MQTMPNATGAQSHDAVLIGGLLERVALDLSTIMGRELNFTIPAIERAKARPAGKGGVHISFKLALHKPGEKERHGALLVPLSDAISMACFLLMIPDESIASHREQTTLETTLKDAMLEIGNMIGSACNTALGTLGTGGWSMRSEGCQGVRANVRPAFDYEEGSELVVGRTSAHFEPFEPFELILMLPPIA